MKKNEFVNMLLEMIENSEVVMNRLEFRTMYFVCDIKKIRKNKLLNISDPNDKFSTYKAFRKCEYFMKVSFYPSYNIFVINFNNECYEKLISIDNLVDNYYFKIVSLIRSFLIEKYNFPRNGDYRVAKENITELTSELFENDHKYKKQSENKTIVFDFKQHKFDVLNSYKYQKIV